VIDQLRDRAMDLKIAVAYFYCDFQSQEMQTPGDVLGALVKQIVCELGAIPAEIDEAFRKAKNQLGGGGLRVPEAHALLKAALAPLDRAFICIDALDELLVKHLPKLLSSLYDISQSCPGVRFLFTGRPHIGVEIEKYFPGAARFLQIEGTKEGIMRYVEMMLDDDPNPEAMNTGLREEIINRISETISDVYAAAIFRSKLEVSLIVPRFLLVSLNITAILDEATIFDRREQLKRVTSGRGLNDAYGVTLDRIKGQALGKSKLAMATLMWISRSKRPMSPGELCHALGVRIGSTDPRPDSIPSMQTLLAFCLGLIAVDREGSTVRLVHFTLQEYLDSCFDIFHNPHAVMAEICLTYLNFDCIRKLPPTLDTQQKYPFLYHSSSCWGYYARNKTTEGVKSLALQLLDQFESHISSRILLGRDGPEIEERERLSTGFTGLHCAAFMGIDEIAEALLDMRDWVADEVDHHGCTPLMWASMYGHEGIIRLLLEKMGASLNKKDTSCGQTPLSWASEAGNEGVVELLLKWEEVIPDSRDNSGRTPLSYGAEAGSEGIVKLLLQRKEVNPESLDDDGRTPLSHAARVRGGVGVVKLLLEREEVNPESRDNSGRTPLSHAAPYGDEGAVKLLLKRQEVKSESRDKDGRTPLSHAAGSERGRGVFKLLLESEEVNPESRDNSGRTPLSHAACAFRAMWVVELLLEQDKVDPESRDNNGRTPLSHAASGKWSWEAVKLLLERKEVNPESRDNSGRTPLSHAAGSFDREEAAELLLEREEVDPESRDDNGRTPLSYAACGYLGGDILKLLLERGRVDPESPDDYGRTPLSYAAEGGDRRVPALLLEQNEVDPESRDNYGRTPLTWAASYGQGEMAELLLERGANPESQDNYGRTPLSWAAWYGREITAKLLLEKGKVSPESSDGDGRTPLSYAVESGSERMLEMLLEREDVNPESRDNFGRTPLSYAAGGRCERILNLLLQRDGVNPESRDIYGRTPLGWAAWYGRAEMAELLLAREEVNPESQDNDGLTPLALAPPWGGAEIVKLLLARHRLAPTPHPGHPSSSQP